MAVHVIGLIARHAQSVRAFYIVLACMFAVIALVLIINHSYSNLLTAYSVAYMQLDSV
jgi:type III secretory pathway component EscT